MSEHPGEVCESCSKLHRNLYRSNKTEHLVCSGCKSRVETEQPELDAFQEILARIVDVADISEDMKRYSLKLVQEETSTLEQVLKAITNSKHITPFGVNLEEKIECFELAIAIRKEITKFFDKQRIKNELNGSTEPKSKERKMYCPGQPK